MNDESKLYVDFGRLIVKKLRDEVYNNYKINTKEINDLNTEDYYENQKNREYDEKYRKIDDERFEFIKGLNKEQKIQLDKIILKTLDEVAFNFLREVEEGYNLGNSISLKFKEKEVDDIHKEFSSGTFFGEYFVWLKLFSDFGEYQY